MSTPLIRVRVTAVRAQALDVLSVELVAQDGQALPPAHPGAHVDLHLPGGLVRSYSLYEASGAMPSYRVAVGLGASSRGGSRYVHERLRVGDSLQIGAPRNHFALRADAQQVVLVAGGIGITPLMAMARQCAADGRDWTLYYCARTRLRAAFLGDLLALPGGASRVRTWFDDEQGGVFDAAAVFAGTQPPGLQVYCCGPAALMASVEAATASFGPDQVHFERFTASVDPAAAASAKGFELCLQRSGLTLQVAPGQSVLECLESHGVAMPFSCREGLCGTCETQVLEGEVEHHDHVLSAAEHAQHKKMMVCVSRAAGPRLTLDL